MNRLRFEGIEKTALKDINEFVLEHIR